MQESQGQEARERDSRARVVDVVRIGHNLVTRNGVVFGRCRFRDRLHWSKAPIQGERALHRRRDGRVEVTRELKRWLAEWEGAIKAERWEALRTAQERPGWASMERVLQVYPRAAAAQYARSGAPRPATAAATAARVRKLLEELGLPESVSTAALTPERIDDWLTRRVADAEDADRARRSAASSLNQARAIWARWAMPEYRRAGLTVAPCCLEWRRIRAPSVPYTPPPDELRRATATAFARLEQEDPPLWTAAALMFLFGMRPVDAKVLTWERFVQADGRRLLSYMPSKTRLSAAGRQVTIPVAEAVYQRLRVAAGGSEPFVVPAEHATAREDMFKRRLNRWVRGLGWDRARFPKAGYELRKLFASAVLNTAGIEWAAAYLGDNPETVRKYYAAVWHERAPLVDPAAAILRTIPPAGQP